MQLIINFYNKIKDVEDVIEIQYPYVDYSYWRYINNIKNDIDIINVLEDILIKLDCTKEIDCGRICMTNTSMYKNYLSEYYYYIIKFNNQLLYNKYIDKLIQRHIKNIVFEYNNPIINNNKKSNKVKNKNKIKNKYVRTSFVDMFDNSISYMYTNPVTNDEIISKDPCLLDDLNNKNKKKKSKSKCVGVAIDLMTFSFKK